MRDDDRSTVTAAAAAGGTAVQRGAMSASDDVIGTNSRSSNAVLPLLLARTEYWLAQCIHSMHY